MAVEARSSRDAGGTGANAMNIRRDVPTAVQTSLDSGLAIAPCNMVFLDFTGDPTYFHDSVGTIDWNGHTWIGLGKAGSVSPVLEETEGKSKEFAVQLSGIDTDVMNAARSMSYKNRTAQMLIGFRSIVTGAIIDTTELIYGVMQRMEAVDGLRGAPSHVRITIEDEISLLDNNKGLWYDQATVQQKLGITSTMFLWTARLPLLTFKLGARNPAGNVDRIHDVDWSYDDTRENTY